MSACGIARERPRLAGAPMVVSGIEWTGDHALHSARDAEES